MPRLTAAAAGEGRVLRRPSSREGRRRTFAVGHRIISLLIDVEV